MMDALAYGYRVNVIAHGEWIGHAQTEGHQASATATRRRATEYRNARGIGPSPVAAAGPSPESLPTALTSC